MQFGTNHLGHAMLIHNLLPLLQKAADDRENGEDADIVILTPLGFNMAPSGIPFDELKTTQGLHVAVVPLLAEQAGQPAVCTRATATVVYVTNLGKILGPGEGAYSSLRATTTSKEKVASGAFYEPVRKLGGLDAKVKDEGLAGELWEWTQTVLDEFGS
ncbi:hypothetical protein BJY00DRAFT_315484 [Aspergillus carlsbadensis]|nr:hypothetical protein BJY00DRAFT_315484 [Aspergillus carlsbadensis]